MEIRIIRSIRNSYIVLFAFSILMASFSIALAVPPLPSVDDDPPPLWLEISSISPSNNSISQQKGTTNTFSVTLNQQASSKWFLDGTGQPQTSLSYTKAWSAGDLGLHNITYIGSATDDTVSHTWAVAVLDFVDNAPVASLVSPESQYVADSISVAFICSATDDIGLANMTLFGSWSGWGAKKTNALTGASSSTEFTANISEGEYVWNCMAQDSIGNKGLAAGNNTLIVNLTATPTPKIPLTAAYARITKWPNAINISPGSSVNFKVTVKNSGGESADGLFLESAGSWIKLGGEQFTLGADETMTFSANLSVPPVVMPGPYPVGILLKTFSKTFDEISISVIVLDKFGSANLSTSDIEGIRQELEQVKNRIVVLSGQGYDTAAAKKYANAADDMFNKTEYLNASDHIALADRELEKSVSWKNTAQVALKSYVLFGIVVCILVFLYIICKKYLDKKKKSALNDFGLNASTGENSDSILPQENAEEEELVKRLSEIKKRVGN